MTGGGDEHRCCASTAAKERVDVNQFGKCVCAARAICRIAAPARSMTLPPARVTASTTFDLTLVGIAREQRRDVHVTALAAAGATSAAAKRGGRFIIFT